MKKIIIAMLGMLLLLMIGCGNETRKHYNINGIDLFLVGDISKAKKAIPTARILFAEHQGDFCMGKAFNGTHIIANRTDGSKNASIYAPFAWMTAIEERRHAKRD